MLDVRLVSISVEKVKNIDEYIDYDMSEKQNQKVLNNEGQYSYI